MKFNYLTTKLPFLAALGLVLSLASCGSYQYSGYENDGIYGPENRTVEYVVEKEKVVVNEDQGGYYQNYFSEKSREYDMILGEDEIFTDIDSYKGEYDEEYVDTLLYDRAYAGWGQATNDVTINIYDNGWNNPWFGGGLAWGWNGWWGRPWGWGWNSWGWNRPWGWGWNSWGWNAGFGWGWGWNDPWLWNGGFGWGWNNWGWNNFYGNPYNGRRGYAFNRTRRGSILNRDFNTTGRRSTMSRTRGNNVRSFSTPRGRNSQFSTPRRNSTRSYTPRNNPTRPRASTPRNSSPRNVTPRNSSPRNYTPRSSGRSRSSGSFRGGSSSPSRSSGGSRSSSSSRGGRGRG